MQIFLTKKYYTSSKWIYSYHTYPAKGANRHSRGLVGSSKFLQCTMCTTYACVCMYAHLEIKNYKNQSAYYSYS